MKHCCRNVMFPINVSLFVHLRNIVAETLCFLSLFPCLSTSGNIVAETLCFLSMFPCWSTSGNIVAETLCFLSMFPCLSTSGNIVAETLCFLSMFPCLSTSGTLLRKQNLPPGKQKCFPSNSEPFLLDCSMFPILPTCFQMFLRRERLIS